jgi:hypothetical protein
MLLIALLDCFICPISCNGTISGSPEKAQTEIDVVVIGPNCLSDFQIVLLCIYQIVNAVKGSIRWNLVVSLGDHRCYHSDEFCSGSGIHGYFDDGEYNG